jgi:DNA-binding LacI/PurR family transcriptional regulator
MAGEESIPETVTPVAASGMATLLTSVRQPLTEMGRQAVRTLLAEVQDGSVGPTTIPLQAELRVRESTVGTG